MPRRSSLFLLSMALLLLPVAASAARPRPQIQLQAAPAATGIIVLRQGVNGYTGATDTWINSFAPADNHGTSAGLEIRGAGQSSSLFHFDMVQLPIGATITHATLELNANLRNNDPAVEVAAFGLLRPWNPNTATWEQAAPGAPWGGPGATAGGVDRSNSPTALTLSLIHI